MIFNKYKERGAYHYQWYKDNTFGYRDLVDYVVDFCKGSTMDLGCGDGIVARKIHSKYHSAVVGIDNDPTAIQLAWKAENYNSNFLDFKVRDLNEPIGIFVEYMACLNVIEHLERPERIVEIFKENITKAAIIITDKPSKTLGEYHVHEFTKKELLDLFKDFKPAYFEIGDFHGVKVIK